MTQLPDPYLEESPQYIVVFNAPGPANQEVLAQVLEAQIQPEASSIRASRTVLQSRNGVHARIYQQLAVAATNLSAAQVQQLEVHPEVLKVVRNQRRRLPPVYVGMPAQAALEDERQQMYLRGMRDMLNQLLGEPVTLPAASSLRPLALDGPPETASPKGWSRALEQIGLMPDYRGPTGRQVKVAVLDTGIDLLHPDFTLLQGNIKSFVPSEPDVQDLNGHGTHCAGIIAGHAQPAGAPRYSVAPDAELLISKVLDRFGSGYDDQILEAIDWARDQGAEIISMSLGSTRLTGQPYSDPYEVVARALLDVGIVLVAAAGNDSRRPVVVAPVNNPAACPSVLTVAAVDQRDRVASFSCGDVDGIGTVEVAAPGVGILSAMPGGGYQRLSGTSMATPHVAGVLALLREQNPGLTGTALWSRLMSSAKGCAAPVTDVGAGIVQVP